MARQRQDLTGQRFGRLYVVKPLDQGHYECVCDCGRSKRIRGSNLLQPLTHKRNPTRTCGNGCPFKYEFTNNDPRALTYRTYYSIMKRTQLEHHIAYPSYGGRGVQMYARWIGNPEQFEKDIEAEIGLRPSALQTLDRIDPDGHYEPGNLRWATAKEQAQNKRKKQSA